MSELLFEIGCEELPERAVRDALTFIQSEGEKLAEQLGTKEKPTVQGSPRRLFMALSAVPALTPKSSYVKVGPPASRAWDADGKPTPMNVSFTASVGLDVSKAYKHETPKGLYVAVTVEAGGEDTALVATKFLEQTLGAFPFSKSMRWGSQEVKFARPVQWLMATLGGKVLPLKFGALQAKNLTRGHRFMANEPFAVTGLKQYQDSLLDRHVIVDPVARRAAVLAEARKAAKEAGGHLFADTATFPELTKQPLIVDRYFDSLLDEVTELCEQPFGVFGEFDKDALKLPREVVLTTMRAHQRYFAIVDDKGVLLPRFVTIAATRVKDPALVRRGNERVLKARLNDASYFFTEDQKRPLASRLEDLKHVTYHKKIGTSFEKVERTKLLAEKIAAAVGENFGANLGRAVDLSKADLTTLMVGEFPELQGSIGADYARSAGENEAVVNAISEHYMPRSAEDGLPASTLGAVVALADKLDTLEGIIKIGQAPGGSSDPFALRRAALGVIRILEERKWSLDLQTLGLSPKTLDFIGERFSNWQIKEQLGVNADSVRAVMATGFTNPELSRQRIMAVRSFAQNPEFDALKATLKRVINIIKDKKTGALLKVEGLPQVALFQAEAEGKLHHATQEVADFKAKNPRSFEKILQRVGEMRPVVDKFFDDVMVNDKDESVKINRQRLLLQVAALTSDIADFEKL